MTNSPLTRRRFVQLAGLGLTSAATMLSSAAFAQSVTLPPAFTPKPPPIPRINGARVFGVRPGNPFLFTLAGTALPMAKCSYRTVRCT
jgi:alpha-galactosidase